MSENLRDKGIEMFNTVYCGDLPQPPPPGQDKFFDFMLEGVFGKLWADDTLSMRDRRLVLLTGPNMAGKSTWIRQNALIVVLAQIGSFVPAKQAHIGLVDRVFTRVGGADDISRGSSTFKIGRAHV